jgi:hypothetical protein
VPAAAAGATLLLRLPFVAERLWDHDSVQFALAVADFDLAAHHPHPPGYPVYVGVLKALAALGVGPVAGMVSLALLFQCLGAALIAVLAFRLAAPAGEGAATSAALLAAALYATNPLVWFYGELPLVYGLEAGLTVVLAWAVVGMADGRRRFLVACGLCGLAGGIRPSTLVLLAPLFAWGVWRAWRRGRARRWEAGGPPLRPRDLAAGATVAAAAVAAWLVPLLADAGGLAAYRTVSDAHFTALLPRTSILYGAGWPALAHNLEVLAKWGAQGLVPAAVLVAALAITRPRGLAAGLRLLGRRLDLVAVWALPALAFFALFHVTKAGYTLVHLPALLVAAALSVAPAAPGGARRWAAVGLAAAVGGGLFLAGAERAPDQPRWLAAVRHEHNREAIAGYERDLDELRSALRRFPPERTLLAALELSGGGGAGAEGFLYPYHRHLQWYAPRYPVALLVPEEGFALVTPGGRRDFHRRDGVVPVPAGTRRVLFVLAGPPGRRAGLPPGEVVLANGTFLVLAVPFPGELRVGPLVLRAPRSGAPSREAAPAPGRPGQPSSGAPASS